MYQEALGKRLAIVLWAKDSDDEDDVAVFTGVLRQNADGYFLEREGQEPSFQIQTEWLSRIKSVSEKDIKEILLESDYALSLSVGNAELEDGPFAPTGLKWPNT